MHLKDATFLVTGGGSGLGAATVRELVSAGGNAIIADVNEPAGRALVEEVGHRARFVRTDVADEASVKAAVAAALSTYGNLRGASTAPASASPHGFSARTARTTWACSRESYRSTWWARST